MTEPTTENEPQQPEDSEEISSPPAAPMGAGGAGQRVFGLERWVQFGFVVLAAVAAWLLSNLIPLLWHQLAIYVEAVPEAMPSVSGALAAVLGIVTAISLYRYSRLKRLGEEVVRELARVTWPTKQETYTATVVVIVTSIVVAALLGVMDALWSWVTDVIYHSGTST